MGAFDCRVEINDPIPFSALESSRVRVVNNVWGSQESLLLSFHPVPIEKT